MAPPARHVRAKSSPAPGSCRGRSVTPRCASCAIAAGSSTTGTTTRTCLVRLGAGSAMGEDPLNKRFGEDWARLTKDLLFDSKGSLKFKPEFPTHRPMAFYNPSAPTYLHRPPCPHRRLALLTHLQPPHPEITPHPRSTSAIRWPWTWTIHPTRKRRRVSKNERRLPSLLLLLALPILEPLVLLLLFAHRCPPRRRGRAEDDVTWLIQRPEMTLGISQLLIAGHIQAQDPR